MEQIINGINNNKLINKYNYSRIWKYTYAISVG